jgi:hypothetical protein
VSVRSNSGVLGLPVSWGGSAELQLLGKHPEDVGLLSTDPSTPQCPAKALRTHHWEHSPVATSVASQ